MKSMEQEIFDLRSQVFDLERRLLNLTQIVTSTYWFSTLARPSPGREKEFEHDKEALYQELNKFIMSLVSGDSSEQ